MSNFLNLTKKSKIMLMVGVLLILIANFTFATKISFSPAPPTSQVEYVPFNATVVGNDTTPAGAKIIISLTYGSTTIWTETFTSNPGIKISHTFTVATGYSYNGAVLKAHIIQYYLL